MQREDIEVSISMLVYFFANTFLQPYVPQLGDMGLKILCGFVCYSPPQYYKGDRDLKLHLYTYPMDSNRRERHANYEAIMTGAYCKYKDLSFFSPPHNVPDFSELIQINVQEGEWSTSSGVRLPHNVLLNVGYYIVFCSKESKAPKRLSKPYKPTLLHINCMISVRWILFSLAPQLQDFYLPHQFIPRITTFAHDSSTFTFLGRTLHGDYVLQKITPNNQEPTRITPKNFKSHFSLHELGGEQVVKVNTLSNLNNIALRSDPRLFCCKASLVHCGLN